MCEIWNLIWVYCIFKFENVFVISNLGYWHLKTVKSVSEFFSNQTEENSEHSTRSKVWEYWERWKIDKNIFICFIAMKYCCLTQLSKKWKNQVLILWFFLFPVSKGCTVWYVIFHECQLQHIHHISFLTKQNFCLLFTHLD